MAQPPESPARIFAAQASAEAAEAANAELAIVHSLLGVPLFHLLPLQSDPAAAGNGPTVCGLAAIGRRDVFQTKQLVLRTAKMTPESRRTERVFFLRSGLVSMSCELPGEHGPIVASLGTLRAGAILGVGTVLPHTSRARRAPQRWTSSSMGSFVYKAETEVETISFNARGLARRCSPAMIDAMDEYANAIPTLANVAHLVASEDGWLAFRSKQLQSCAGIKSGPRARVALAAGLLHQPAPPLTPSGGGTPYGTPCGTPYSTPVVRGARQHPEVPALSPDGVLGTPALVATPRSRGGSAGTSSTDGSVRRMGRRTLMRNTSTPRGPGTHAHVHPRHVECGPFAA